MLISKVTVKQIAPELKFLYSRSSGPGGQYVNKANTRVQLRWNITTSQVLNEDQRAILLKRLSHRLTRGGELVLNASSSRSQSANRKSAFQKLESILNQVFTFARPRRATTPTAASHKKRLEKKKHHSEKKAWRRKLKPGRAS
ncbi:MAG: alternative ribosome rescue aminoacyl-tRNA hydrolase ArfB [Cyclobacteriaceae bacterium]|nr:aminoacyl-tRNA hydrolase [Cyclobacteriaceae bacterium]MCX7636222.1 alternative ribosome rescue aminoacyl-tRNA hydrolase ArfB [Cyclobacteriaceae bacterium]MDW8331400.1 alternative ribosome rescue aminoacyl-tRNA hydrolase ArfB [Cyclobacteriaceae bacterium]